MKAQMAQNNCTTASPCKDIDTGQQTRLRLCSCYKIPTSDHRELSERPLAHEQQCQSDRTSGEGVSRERFQKDTVLNRRLDDSGSSQVTIRLLKLRPGGLEAILSFELVDYNLLDRPLYTALSYAWGDVQSVEECWSPAGIIRLDTKVADALRVLRSPKNFIYVWVDSLCVNLENAVDIAVRVDQMADIYHNARQVVVWLWNVADRPDLQLESWCGMPYSRIMRSFSLSVFERMYSTSLDTLIDVSDLSEGVESAKGVGAFTLQELEDCRTSLSGVLKCCEHGEYVLLRPILSALAISCRPLTLSEAARISILSLDQDSSTQPLDRSTEFFALQGINHQTLMRKLGSLIHQKWSGLLVLNESGILSFEQSHMQLFLRSLEIPGITPTHSFMANLCLKELILSAAASNSISSPACDKHQSLSDFYSYSFQYWLSHYRMEQYKNAALTGIVHSFLWDDVSSLKPGSFTRHESVTAACSVYCTECLDSMISYCAHHELQCLQDFYVQLYQVSAARSERYNRDSRHEDGSQTDIADRLGILKLSEYSEVRASNVCSRTALSMTQTGSRPRSRVGGTQPADMTEGWVMVESNFSLPST